MSKHGLAGLLALASFASAADVGFLRRNLPDVRPQADELTAGASGASYKPLFGAGDREADQLKSIVRYGELTLRPGASSAIVEHPDEEQIYYVVEGSGTLLYRLEQSPVRQDDFAYLPPGVRHGVANSSAAPLRMIVMGYRIPVGVEVQSTPALLLANSGDVALQVLGQHGPTTQFKLLMGLTSSKRDKLAAAYVMDSLFIMDFAPGGTNIPHRHPAEEEIYLLLRGSGEMVAGLDQAGREIRHPVKEGAAFFFKPGTQVGYYSGAHEGQPHDLILAVRSQMPRR
ncbi:MAG TPA: cupin domain-containing protein [Candidatus Acidoferrales bacterium]|nr:cupin domain-containing protein [Candidatus Acidoferrales bacterium]